MNIMNAEAKGCEVIVSGKLRAQRAKSMKFRDGYMIKSGHCTNDLIDTATRAVLLRQGVIGIKVAIMLPAARGDKKAIQPDVVKVLEPKEEEVPVTRGYAQ